MGTSFLNGAFERLFLKKKQRKFRASYREFQQLASHDRRFVLSEDDWYPRLDDATRSTEFDPHYVYHTAWAARRIKARAPQTHVDISSFLYFATLLSAFIPVQFFDFRPAAVRLDGLATGRADLNRLYFDDNSISSLSCMHTVEHIGLGRYGDSLNPQGDLHAISELVRVLAPGGYLYFVVPIGRPRICFNAHRIYSYAQIVEYFAELQLLEFSLIPDNAQQVGLLEHADPALAAAQNYACGCFIFTKPSRHETR